MGAELIVGLIVAAIGLGSQVVSSSSAKKSRNAAENAAEEQTKALASFAGLTDNEIGTLRAKRAQLIERQKFLLNRLMEIIRVAGKKRWADEYKEMEVKLSTEDFATELTNLIHKGAFGGSYAKKFVEESRQYSTEFNTNARNLRAVNATIDNKLSETDGVVSETEGGETWSAALGNFFKTGQLSGPYKNTILAAVAILVILLVMRSRKTGKKK